MNSKEESSEDFCPNYVQEYSLWAAVPLYGENEMHEMYNSKGTSLDPLHAPYPLLSGDTESDELSYSSL